MRLPHGGGFRSLIAGFLSGDRTAAVGRPNPHYSWLWHSRAARLLDFGAGTRNERDWSASALPCVTSSSLEIGVGG